MTVAGGAPTNTQKCTSLKNMVENYGAAQKGSINWRKQEWKQQSDSLPMIHKLQQEVRLQYCS